MPGASATPPADVRVFSISVAGSTLSIDVHPLVLIAILVLVVLLVALAARRSIDERVVEVTVSIPLGGIGKLRISADREVARLAHQAWIELVTRKAAIPIDEANDVVEEVFNSWYELFRELRAITKSVPASTLRSKNARDLVDTLVRALNDGLRPPLTRWQARFRSWYATERQGRPGEEPQAIQRDYPLYAEMMAEIRSVNADLGRFAEALHAIAQRAREAAAAQA